MSFPKISIAFKGLASSALTRLSNGIVALVFSGEGTKKYVIDSLADMPQVLSADQKEAVELAFMGASKVVVVVDQTIVSGLKVLETERFNYLAAPIAEASDKLAVVSWIKSQREAKGRKVKAVLANQAADHEGIINFTTDGIIVDGKTEAYSAEEFTSRIAGILAGLGASNSATFHVLPEVKDIAVRLTEDEASLKIERGELVLFHDGEKVKIARGVNSLTSLTGSKNASFKKIKLVDIMDMIHQDVKKTAEDNFIGRVRNSYENKLLLCNAINSYFAGLEAEEILEAGMNKAAIDEEATKAYLKATGVDVDLLKPAEIKSYNTGDKLFLSAKISMLDAMEEINFVISI